MCYDKINKIIYYLESRLNCYLRPIKCQAHKKFESFLHIFDNFNDR